MGMKWESLPADAFIELASSPKFLGNHRVRTQHLIGASKFVQTSRVSITGVHQMRVAHQKYKDDECTQVLIKGHAHGKATVEYRFVDGVWKFAGLTPDIRWAEDDYNQIFKDDMDGSDV